MKRNIIKELKDEINPHVEKTTKLETFIGTDNYKKLQPEMQKLLWRQLNAMKLYAMILDERLTLLTTDKKKVKGTDK